MDARPALFYAAVGGHAATVSLLVEAKACVNSRDNMRRTPLQMAVTARSLSTVRLLLGAKADVSKHSALSCGCSLLGHVKAKCRGGQFRHNDLPCVRLLVQHGALQNYKRGCQCLQHPPYQWYNANDEPAWDPTRWLARNM
jgi:ankyrin repeat protein